MTSYMEYARASRRLDEIDRKLGKAAREEACLRKVIYNHYELKIIRFS